MHREVDHHHLSWYKEAVTEKIGSRKEKPKTALIQQNWDNVPSIHLFLDHLNYEIFMKSLCFSNSNMSPFNAFHGLPSRVLPERDWRRKFMIFLSLHSDDLDSAESIHPSCQTGNVRRDLHGIFTLHLSCRRSYKLWNPCSFTSI